MLGFVSGNECQDVATLLVLFWQLRSGITVRDLGGPLLHRNVGNQVAQIFEAWHHTRTHLNNTAFFEAGWIDAARNVHPVTHDH